jgi:hypothetical protein
LIYFKDENEKEVYIKEVNHFFNTYRITDKTKRLEVINKIVEFENTGKHIDFLRNVPIFESYSRLTNDYKTEYLKDENTFSNGFEKINNYYSALNFIATNVKRKKESNYLDFEFEDNLFEQVVVPSNKNNYAYIDTITFLAIQHDKANNKVKSKYYFDEVLKQKERSSLTPKTLGKFFRKIGEHYYEIKEFDECLKWLLTGIELNPKLGVKRKIEELKRMNL